MKERTWKSGIFAKRQVALVILALAGVAFGASLTEADKKEGLAQLERTRNGVVAETNGLSDAQWKFKPGPDRWSVAEIAEHIAVVEEFLLDSTSKNVMKAPAGKPDRDNQSLDRLVLTAIADRSKKVLAPEPVVPRGRWTPPESLDRFLKARQRTVDFLKSTSDLRDHVVDSPLGQPLDAYQWLLYISAHSERHTKQILEVKADPNFPKK
jgi:DinB family protein